MTTLYLRNSVGRSPLRHGLLFIPLLFTCVLLPPSMKAQEQCYVDPPCTGTTRILHFNILGNDAGFYDNISVGCGALYNAQTLNCDGGVMGDFSFHYYGPVMYSNTAVGSHALCSNSAGGNYNSATGAYSLYSNTTGDSNTASGYKALYSNTTSPQSTAVGYQALMNAIRGANEAFGASALFHNTLGIGNTALGLAALNHNTTGYYNVGVGDNAGALLTTGSGNVCIGWNVFGVAGESNTTRIRNVYSSVASARPVYVNSDNKIGTLASTRRVKEDIKPMDKTSEAILALQPVSFRYKKEIDASGTAQFGLIAEEVAEVDPDLVSRDGEGKPEAVRYEAVNAMLLNEFLKEHRKVQEQEATITQLKSTAAKQEATITQQRKDFQATVAQQQEEIKALSASLKEQAAQIQKVSAQLELNKPAPQIVVSNQ